MRQQNDALHELRGQIEKHIGEECSKIMLKRNGQYVPRDKNEVIEIIFWQNFVRIINVLLL